MKKLILSNVFVQVLLTRVNNFFLKRKYLKDAHKTTFAELSSETSSMSKVNVSEFNFEELNEFREKVEAIQKRLTFLLKSKSVNLGPVEHIKRSYFAYRIGKVIDKINAKEEILQKTPYVNKFKHPILT